MSKKYAVLGDPVDHSWSPFIHKSFAKQFNLSIEYEKIKVLKGSLNNNLTELIKKNFSGCNVTVPLKQEAYQLAIKNKWNISNRAVKAKAINTIFFRKNNIFVDNTDGVGLFRDLGHHGLSKINNANVLIIGAGGAVRGILPMFSENKFTKVTVVNRSESNLQLLSKVFKSDLFEYKTIDNLNDNYSEFKNNKNFFAEFDLIINATSASIGGCEIKIPKNVFLRCPLAVDLFYSSQPTSFMNFALISGAIKAVDGLGMLVEQAAESFYIWTANRPSTKGVLDDIRFKMPK